MNIFEQASRAKLRFQSTKGQLTVEQLWDVPLTGAAFSLNEIAKSINANLKDREDDFVPDVVSVADTESQLGLEIVKYIIGVRVAEAKAAREASQTRQELQRLYGLVAQKQQQQEAELTLEELQARIAALTGK
jgi:hypothetical protein